MIDRLMLLFEDLIVFQHDLETVRPDLVEDMDKITGDLENFIYKMKEGEKNDNT